MIKLHTALTIMLMIFCTGAMAQDLEEDVSGLDADGEPIPLATYIIQNAAPVGDIDPSHLVQWQRFASIIPANQRAEITKFQPIDAATTGGVDGAVAPDSDDRSQWLFQIDVGGSVEQHELDRTMVHEYAHLLTLRLDQVPAFTEDEPCDNYLVSDGCLNANSYLAEFGDIFWPEGNGEDWDAEETFSDDPESFVTEYAATSVIEDAAETFAEFVVHPERWNGTTIADSKVRFWSGYPEIVVIQQAIRQGLSLN